MKTKILTLIAALPALMSILYVAYRVFFDNVNHVGLTPHYLDVPAVVSVLLALAFRLERRALWAVAAIAALNVFVVVWAIDTNILVEYEEWIRRGMPKKSVGIGSS